MKLTSLTIFISSTFVDLERYREAANTAIRRLHNHAEDMIFWSADDRAPSEASIDKVTQSDLLVLLLAHRYGTIPPDETSSIVELEYSAAREKHIPVLAFFVEPDYPWPPHYMEFDSERRTKLLEFKRQVESDCVRQFFTTTESLAIALTQAVANFDRRRATSDEPDLGRRITQELVRTRSDLTTRVDLTVPIGLAEDGLFLGVRIIRSQDISSRLNQIAGDLNTSTDRDPLLTISKGLNDEGSKVWRETGLHQVQLPDGTSPKCYVTYQNLTSFFVPSLITRLLTAANRNRGAILRHHHYNASSINTSQSLVSGLSARHGRDERVQSSGGSNRFLAISTTSDDVYVVGWRLSADRRSRHLKFWRQFINESVLSLSEWTFEVREYRPSFDTRVVAAGDSKVYEQKVFRILEKPKYSDSVSYTTRFRISRRSLAQMIMRAADKLKPLHAAGSIHGDLKPQNILLSHSEPVLIDSLNLEEDEIPPALSPDWAAPEQLLMQPVSKATDIYPLGLMLCGLVGGQLTGEYVQYLLPSRDREELIVPLVRNPLIYVDPQDKELILASRKPWFDFIENCLSFEKSSRPKDANEFVSELNSLCNKYPLEGSVRIDIGPPVLPELAVLNDGSERPFRILVDRWASLKRPPVVE